MSLVDVLIVFNIAVDDPFVAIGLLTNLVRINESMVEFVAVALEWWIGFMFVHPEWFGVLEQVECCY